MPINKHTVFIVRGIRVILKINGARRLSPEGESLSLPRGHEGKGRQKIMPPTWQVGFPFLLRPSLRLNHAGLAASGGSREKR